MGPLTHDPINNQRVIIESKSNLVLIIYSKLEITGPMTYQDVTIKKLFVSVKFHIRCHYLIC